MQSRKILGTHSKIHAVFPFHIEDIIHKRYSTETQQDTFFSTETTQT